VFAISLRRNGPFDGSDMEQIDGDKMVRHANRQQAPISGDGKILRMADLIMAAVRREDTESLKRFLGSEAGYFLRRHAIIVGIRIRARQSGRTTRAHFHGRTNSVIMLGLVVPLGV